jgi:hypothetical protein
MLYPGILIYNWGFRNRQDANPQDTTPMGKAVIKEHSELVTASLDALLAQPLAL